MKVVGGRRCLWWYINKEWLRRSILLLIHKVEDRCWDFLPKHPPQSLPLVSSFLPPLWQGRSAQCSLYKTMSHYIADMCNVPKGSDRAHGEGQNSSCSTVQKSKVLCVVWRCSSLLWHSTPNTICTLCVVWFNAMLQCRWLRYTHQVMCVVHYNALGLQRIKHMEL